MINSKTEHRLFGAALPLLIGMFACGLSGCKKPQGSGSASPSGSSSAGAAKAASGPCGTYTSKICEKAGPESPACQSITAAADLLPPAACVAGMKDLEFTVKALAKQHLVCDELVEKLCAAVGPKTQTCKMVTTQTKQFTPDRCKQLSSHMTEVITELKNMEQANQPLSPELRAALVRDPAATFGPANAKVEIVQFSDFQCPYCAKAADVVHQIKAKYGDRVKFVFRQFPLTMHPRARDAAEAALAAGSQGKFWEFHDLLFKNQQQLGRANLEEHAKAAGLDVAAFKKALDEHKYGPAIDADLKLGADVKVQGTPSMFVNGARVSDPASFAPVAEMIESALSGQTPG
jgi:protein-disulfide isomerase